MPRPPVLDRIDWQNVMESGTKFDVWLSEAENAEHGSQMAARVNELSFAPQVKGYLGALGRRVHVVAIAEDWCGDVVRHVPVLAALERACPNLHVRFITREQNREVFARFLTNGGEAIPKFIFLNEDFVECANWGPMPEPCKRIIARGKACGDIAAARERVTHLYEADSDCRLVIEELLGCIDTAAATAP